MKQEKLAWTNFMVEGDGPPVVLLHGLSASLYDWIWLAPELARAGFRAYAPDLLGHGDSAKPGQPAKYSMENTYSLLQEWLTGININQPFFLVGHSLGGYLSLLLARDYPELVRGMILISPFYHHQQLSPVGHLLKRRPEIGVQAIRLAHESLVYTLIGLDPFTTPTLPKLSRLQTARDYKRASPEVMRIPSTARDLTEDLPGIHRPVKIIWGKQDTTLKPRLFPTLVSSLPQAKGYAIALCGHQPHLSKVKLVNGLVLDFILATSSTAGKNSAFYAHTS